MPKNPTTSKRNGIVRKAKWGDSDSPWAQDQLETKVDVEVEDDRMGEVINATVGGRRQNREFDRNETVLTSVNMVESFDYCSCKNGRKQALLHHMASDQTATRISMTNMLARIKS